MMKSFLLTVLLLIVIGCEPEPAPEISTEIAQGIRMIEEGASADAHVYFTELYTTLLKKRDSLSASEVFGYIGLAQIASGHYHDARATLDAALSQATSLKYYRAESRIRVWNGDLYRRIGNNRKALSEYTAALSIFSALKMDQGRALVEQRVAELFIEQGYAERALTMLEESRVHARAAGDSVLVCRSYLMESSLHLRAGDAVRSADALRAAEPSLVKSDNVIDEIRHKMLAGRTLKMFRKQKEALGMYRGALDVIRRKPGAQFIQPALEYEVARLYAEYGGLQEGMDLILQAEERAGRNGDRFAEAYSSLQGTMILEELVRKDRKQNEIPRIITSYQEAAKRFSAIEQYHGAALALTRLSSFYRRKGDMDRALATALKAVTESERDPRVQFVEQREEPFLWDLSMSEVRDSVYSTAIDQLLARGRTQEAMVIAERKRILEAGHVLSGIPLTPADPSIQNNLLQALAIGEEVNLLAQELRVLLSRPGKVPTDTIRVKAQEIRSRLNPMRSNQRRMTQNVAVAYPNALPLLPPQVRTPASLQRSIPAATTVVELVFGSTDAYLVVVTRSGIASRRLSIPTARLQNMMNEYLRLLNDPVVYAGTAGEQSIGPMFSFDSLSSKMYDLLLRPFETSARANIVIVTGLDQPFPFHTLLRREKNGTRMMAQEKFAIDYLPMITALSFKVNAAVKPRSISAFGNVDGKDWAGDYELRDLRNIARSVTTAIGLDATRVALEKTGSDIVQLSLDFLEDPMHHPLGSMVLSAGQSPGETVEVPFETLGLLRKTQVVYASNKTPGTQQLRPIHALYLRMTGVAEVIIDKKNRDRRTAKQFSDTFYTLIQNGVATGDAFRQSLIKMLDSREIRHPYFWASFFHYGVG